MFSTDVWFTLDRDALKPTKAYEGDAGYDLYTNKEVVIPFGESRDVPTGIKMAMPPGYWAHLVSRSSTYRKLGLVVIDAVIDNGYRGELYIQAVSFRQQPQPKRDKFHVIPKGSRIAQLIFHRIEEVKWVERSKLPESDRGEQGFGSSGR